MKICSLCKEEKPFDAYHLRSDRGNRRADCKTCCQKRITPKLPGIRLKRKIEMVTLMGPECSSCGGIFPPSCYDFHHKDLETKERSPTYYLLGSKEKRQKIMDDCILLCANCHRIEHNPTRSIPPEWLEE